MIDKIITNYSPRLSTFVKNSAKGIFNNKSVVSKYKDAIRQYLDIVDSRQAISDAFISAFSANPEIFCNENAGAQEYSTTNNYSHEISVESAEIIQSMFANDNVADILTFTDGNGIPYSFIKMNAGDVEGYTPIISTQQHPKTVKDLLLYKDDEDHFYFNPIVRTAEFYDGSEIVSIQPENVLDTLEIFCNIAGASSYNHTVFEMFESLQGVYEFCDIENPTIMDYVTSWVNFCSGTPDGTLNQIVEEFVGLAANLLINTGSTRIKSTTAYSLVKDLVVNNEMLDVIRNTYDNIVNGDTNEFINSVKAQVSSKSDIVKSFGNQIILGFTRNGVVGALSVIVDLLKKVFESEPSGYAVFNTVGSIPQAFSAGLVGIITSVASTLFQVLSNVMHPIVSIIGAIGYGIFNTITGVVNANISEEYARVDDLNSSENIAPYAIFGKLLDVGSYPANSILATYIYNDNNQQVKIKDLLDWCTCDGHPIMTMTWYGLIIKLGYADPVINDNGVLTATKLVMNVFPSVNNTASIFNNTVGDRIFDDLKASISWSLDSAGVGWIAFPTFSSTIYNILNDAGQAVMSNGYSDIDFTPVFVNDDTGQYAGYAVTYDAQMRTQVYQNILLFFGLCYRMSLTTLPINYISGSNKVDVKIIDLVPQLSLSGEESPLLDIVIGSISNELRSFGELNGHYVFMSDKTSSYESLGKACLAMQNSNVSSSGYYYIEAMRRLRSSYTNGNGVTISFRSTYKDIPYFIAPKYTRGSVVKALVIGAILAITTAVAVAVTTIAVKRKIQKQRAIRSAKVENAWSDLTKNPTPENYNAYRKTVRANNTFSRVFGGTKYDYTNYWSSSSSTPTSSSSLYETIVSYGENGDESTTTEQPVNSIATLISLINGDEF